MQEESYMRAYNNKIGENWWKRENITSSQRKRTYYVKRGK